MGERVLVSSAQSAIADATRSSTLPLEVSNEVAQGRVRWCTDRRGPWRSERSRSWYPVQVWHVREAGSVRQYTTILFSRRCTRVPVVESEVAAAVTPSRVTQFAESVIAPLQLRHRRPNPRDHRPQRGIRLGPEVEHTRIPEAGLFTPTSGGGKIGS